MLPGPALASARGVQPLPPQRVEGLRLPASRRVVNRIGLLSSLPTSRALEDALVQRHQFGPVDPVVVPEVLPHDVLGIRPSPVMIAAEWNGFLIPAFLPKSPVPDVRRLNGPHAIAGRRQHAFTTSDEV